MEEARLEEVKATVRLQRTFDFIHKTEREIEEKKLQLQNDMVGVFEIVLLAGKAQEISSELGKENPREFCWEKTISTRFDIVIFYFNGFVINYT